MSIRTRLLGLGATVLVVAILAGLPTLLLALGANPVPNSVPSLDQIRTALTTPDDGTLAMGAITLIAWVAWLVLAASIVLEVVAKVRGLSAPALPGLGMPQVAARHLVAAAALLFVVLPSAAPSVSAAAAPAPAAVTVTAPASAVTTAPVEAPQGVAAQERPSTYVVQSGDSLSTIAQRELGAGHRWSELADLNPHVADHPDLIHAGTVLILPTPATVGLERSYTVKAGDTLSKIAQRELGDADRYPEIFHASKDTLQPGQVRLTDPDRIDIGQTLTIPATAAAPAAAAPAAPVVTPAPAATPPREGSGPAGTQAQPSPAPAAPAAAVPEVAITPTPAIPAGASQQAPAAQTASAEDTAGPTVTPWMLAGLTGGGALLAGSMQLMLRRRRRTQFRSRRPGRTLAAPEVTLSPVEKTITSIGAVTAPTVEHMDLVLRRLAAAAARDGSTMPELAAVELTAAHVVIHLGEPAELPAPWSGSDDGYHWKVTADIPADQIGPDVPDQPAPYPLLVTIGLGEHDELWLLNLEDLNVSITGDPTYGHDFARYLAAEVACNPWSAGVDVACVGVATELEPLNPDRIHVYSPGDTVTDPVGEYVAEAVRTIDRVADAGTDVTTSRAHQTGADAWQAKLLLVDAATEDPALDQLLALVHAHAGHTGTSVVVRGHRPQTPGTVLEVTADGRVDLPAAGLNLVAVGLTSDEAEGCAALMAHADTLTDIPVPADEDATHGWRSFADEAGALRPEHTLPRHEQDSDDGADPAATLLVEDDTTYLDVAATTKEDLQALAPRVAQSVRHEVEGTDPTLDDDVAMWFRDDAALPKLRLLGPVRATTRGKPLTKRKPYMTELLAFIALRRLGATTDEVADTFNITKAKARDYVVTIRAWLGTNPRTGTPHLPDAREAPAAAIREVPVYEVVDLLIDIDLFRRLRVRGEARGGRAGIDDLRAALRLVEGRPFDHPIEREGGGGWSWLVDGDRLDEHTAVAVVDVAHLVTSDALAQGDLATARLAAETAALAAPYEEIPRLDLAAVAAAEGRHAEAQRIIRDEICNRTDDDGPPTELPSRTEEILGQRSDWLDRKVS